MPPRSPRWSGWGGDLLGKPDVVGIELGFAKLDKPMAGHATGPGDSWRARPSVGKSALALNFAESVAVDHGKPVGLFTLEMTESQQRSRLICSRAHIDMAKVRERLTSDVEFAG